MTAHYEQQRRLFDGGRRRQVQQHSHPSPQHLFCPQSQQLGPHYDGPASGIWCKRCGRAGHEAKMCAARGPQRFNGIYGTCSERGHLSRHCPLRRDRIYSDVLTLSSPQQINRGGRGGTEYDLPVSPPSFSGRSGGTGCDIPRSPPQYSGSNNGYGTDGVRSSSTDTAPMVAWGTVRHSYSSTAAVVIVILRNRSCDTSAAATVQHCSRSSSKPPPHFSVALAGSKGALAAMDRQ